VELLKFSLIIFSANWLPKHQKLATFLVSMAIPSLLLILQPDLGSLLLILAIGFSLYFFAGGKMKNIAFLGLGAIPIITLIIAFSPYRLERVTTFFNPESDPLGSSFHIRQIVVALGRGGWFGQGFGNSRQKYAYIPEASTDSIFAIVGEESGFIGCLFIIALYLLLIISSYKIATNPKLSPSKQLFGLGINTWITIQTVLNLAAVVSLVPLTGVPLPFFSYGRSSQIMILLAAGCLVRLGKKEV
jgi:cell division protein FtsW